MDERNTRRPTRRVVISGLGIVAPNGIGKEAFWQATISGVSGVRKITRFDASHLPAQISGRFCISTPRSMVSPKERREASIVVRSWLWQPPRLPLKMDSFLHSSQRKSANAWESIWDQPWRM